jgi:cytidylate kinase
MVGRDIGTIVLPEAPLKIYLDASLEVRAERRHRECLERGQERGLEDILDDLRSRDRLDSTRDLAPLMVAGDAHVIDTTDKTIEEVVERTLALARIKSGKEEIEL